MRAVTQSDWKGRRRATSVVLVWLALLSTWWVARGVIIPNLAPRVSVAHRVFRGTMDAPYQYRVLEHLIGGGLQALAAPFAPSAEARHAVGYILLNFAAFLGAYALFFDYLHNFYSRGTSLLGVLMLVVAVPQSLTGYLIDGDVLTLTLYALGLVLMVRGRDAWLPLVLGLGALNREQMVFLVVFYICHLAGTGRLGRRREMLIAAASFAAYVVGVLLPRLYFGFKPNPYSMALVIAHNTNPGTILRLTGPLWLAELGGLVTLALLAWPRSNRFFRWCLVALVFYTILFFFGGIAIELAKFLPAFLILIHVGLQAVSGEFVPNEILSSSSQDARPATDGPAGLGHDSGHNPLY